MRLSLPLSLAATVVAAAAPLRAQSLIAPRRAFELAVSPWVGLASFGHRYTNTAVNVGFYSSVAVGAGLDLPLGQRTGLLLNTEVALRSAQRTKSQPATTQGDRVIQTRADLSLGFRIKATAPIYFFAGGGVIRSAKPALSGFESAVVDPEATFGLGIDKAAAKGSPWNFRAAFVNHIVFPKLPSASDFSGDPGVLAAFKAYGTAYDWTVQIGARRQLHAAAAR